MPTVTPLDFQDFIGTTADEQRWQIVSAIQGQTGLAENVNITGPVDGSGNVKVDIASADLNIPVAVTNIPAVNIQDSTGNSISTDNDVSGGVTASPAASLQVDLFDPSGNQLLGNQGRYDSSANGSNAIRSQAISNGNRLTFSANTSAITVTSSAIIIAASSTRTHLSISNNGLVNILYVNPTGGTASASLGIPIKAGETYTFPAHAVPSGNITAFSVTTTAFVVYA